MVTSLVVSVEKISAGVNALRAYFVVSVTRQSVKSANLMLDFALNALNSTAIQSANHLKFVAAAGIALMNPLFVGNAVVTEKSVLNVISIH